jgi:DNA-directed RNA polymerase subunit RPC12/RpoP
MADIRFHCVICGNGLEITSDLAGGVMECPSCLRVVPVPSLLTCPYEDAGCQPALPPDVLAIEIKFRCATCATKLRLDARWEGRMVTCPVCTTEIRVPEWSRPSRPPAGPAVTPLSAAEIEFLSGPIALSEAGA